MKLTTEYLACQSNLDTAPTLVLLHGWASDREIWRSSLGHLRSWANVLLVDLPGVGTNLQCWAASHRSRIALLAEIIPAGSTVIGWSLGGMLARELALHYPEKIQSVVTLASNSQFVASAEYASAMPADIAEAFADSCKENPIQTLKRFDTLQVKGDSQAKTLRRILREYRDSAGDIGGIEQERLAAYLENLYQLNHRDVALSAPTLSLFGEMDSLVPQAAAQIAEGQSIVIPDAGHLLFLSNPLTVWAAVKRFLSDGAPVDGTPDSRMVIDKTAMQKSFSAAAESYDSVAELQRNVADQLFEQCPNRAVTRVVDLGCGTGYSLPKLQAKYGAEALIAMDIATGMLAKAGTQSDASLLCADAENIPLADNSVDLVFSSMALQWCQNPARWVAEVERILAPGGTALVTTVGTDSLHELKSAWQQVDKYVHVNQFTPEAKLRAAVDKTSLRIESWQEHHQTRYYDKLRDITHELKALGAHNVNSGRPTGLTSRQRIATLQAAYEAQRQAQGLPVSWQFWTLVLRKK